VIFLSFAAVYNFLPSIYVVFAVILWEGLLGGSIYVNTFYLMSQKFTGPEKEFCLGSTSMSYGLSITFAALAGKYNQLNYFVNPYIGIGYEPFMKDLRSKHS
jgi:battenin